MWFDRIKRFYDNGLWNKQQVREAVVVGRITEVQYKEIVDEEY